MIFEQHHQAHYGSHCAISVEIDSNPVYRNQDFGHPLCTGRETLDVVPQQETTIANGVFHTLLWTQSNRMQRAPDSTSKPLWLTSCHYFWVQLPNCMQNTRIWVPSLYGKKSNFTIQRDIHCCWSSSVPSLHIYKQVGGSNGIAYTRPNVVHTMLFLPNFTLKLYTKW